jgi:TRAP transporter TAXI family solute receptor
MKKGIRIVAALLFLCACAGLAIAQADIKPATYTWVAGGMGGGWYTVAGGFANLVNEKEPRITIKVVPGGGLTNPIMLSQGDADIAWGVAWLDKAAFSGQAPLFKTAYKNLCSIAGALSADRYHFLAAKDQNVTTVEEFAKKIKNGEKLKVAGPMTGTSEYVLIGNVLAYYGASFDMIKKNGGSFVQAVYGDMTSLYKDRHVDYALTCVGLPAAIITEMSLGRPSILMAVSDACVDHFAETTGLVTKASGLAVIPGGTYAGMPNNIQALAHATEILVSPKMPEAVVYAMTKILNENKAFLVQMGASYQVFDPKTTATAVQVPLHPGAARYYKEVGTIK